MYKLPFHMKLKSTLAITQPFYLVEEAVHRGRGQRADVPAGGGHGLHAQPRGRPPGPQAGEPPLRLHRRLQHHQGKWCFFFVQGAYLVI